MGSMCCLRTFIILRHLISNHSSMELDKTRTKVDVPSTSSYQKVIADLHAHAAQASPHSLEIWLSIHLRNFSYVTIPSTRPPTPQSNQCEISHFLPGVGGCNMKFHIHVVANWQLSKHCMCWPTSHDRSAGSGIDSSRLRVFWSYPLTSCWFSTDRRLNSKWISLQWLQVYRLK